ncbi:MAG TPA: FAD-dependent oxidoreductase [Aliidiomarina sp.]|nr:FAD-dependent oxidoreductase [Aliidiomarina sp.]
MALIRTQVAIIGGGMIGLALANALALRGRDVCVLERGEAKQVSTEPSLRVSALNRAAQNWLTELGAWQLIPEGRQGTYTGMQVWDENQGARIGFSAEESDLSHIGTIIENAVVEGALWQRAEQLNVQLLTQAVVKNFSEHEHDVSLELENGDTVLAQLVVAADGGRSQMRQELGLPTTFKDYGQHGLVATLTTSEAHHYIARQVFLPTGPLALLPLANPNQISIVWSAPPHKVAELLALPKEDFEQQLTVASDVCLGPLTLASERQAFPLRMQYAEQWLKGRFVLAGDAAHTIHPLAGQGANLGLGDAWYLAEQLNGLGTLQGQWNNDQLQRALRHYERARKTAAVRHIAAMEGFHQLFLIQNPLVKALRAFGLNMTHRARAVKRFFIDQANQF